MKLIKLHAILLICSFLCIHCSREAPLDRLDDIEFTLTAHDGKEINFPTDLKGKYTVFGFFYTHCPDICPLMVANMKRVYDELDGDRDKVQFVFMTFDPKRDSTEVLDRYFKAFKLEEKDWTFVHGNQDQVQMLTRRLGVKVLFNQEQLDEDGNPYYLIDHTDKVSILNEKAELVDHYNASRINPSILARELRNKWQ